jgi:ribosomal protein L11 methyltransferase
MAVTSTAEASELQNMADFYLALGASGVEWEDGQLSVALYTDIPMAPGEPFVRAYFPWDASWGSIKIQLEDCTRLKGWVFRCELVRTQDWENNWKEYYQMIYLPGDYAVVPAWYEGVELPLDHQLILDPAMAFGTGEHPTTKMCLVQIIHENPEGLRVLDLGAGSGILAILAAKMHAAVVRAVEPDPVALRAMQENIARNQVSIATTLGTLADVSRSESFDLALLNLIADIIIPEWPALMHYLHPGSRAILSGILSDRVGDIVTAVEASGAHIQKIVHDGGWAMIVVQR